MDFPGCGRGNTEVEIVELEAIGDEEEAIARSRTDSGYLLAYVS